VILLLLVIRIYVDVEILYQKGSFMTLMKYSTTAYDFTAKEVILNLQKI